MLIKDGAATIKAYAYKIEPKSRFDAGNVKLNGQDTPVKVTTANHTKFPPYTYFRLDGALYYAKGDLRGHDLQIVKEQPAAEEKKEEPMKTDAKPLAQPQAKHGKK